MQGLDTIEFRLRFSTAALLLVLLIAPLASISPRLTSAAGTWYVATGGNDSTGTGSSSKPWRTIQRAADSVGPGSTVLIQPGTYRDAVEISITATSTSPVIFRGNGAGVVIDADTVDRDAVLIIDSSYVTWEKIRIQDAPRAGLRVSTSNHVTIRDNVFANNQRWGLFTDFSDDLLIEGNESYGANIEHGIYHSNSGDRPVIRGNVIHDNYANGIHMNGDISMGGDGIITSAVVEGNYIYDNGTGGGSGINMDGVQSTMVRNNIIVDAHASGISMYRIDGGICSRNNKIYHNTVVVASDGRWAINIPSSGCTGNKLFANILYSHHSYRGAINVVDGARTGFESNFNVLEGVFSTNDGDSILTFNQWKSLGYDANSKVATPAQIFVNPAGDYQLRSASPAINIGQILTSVKHDYAGVARPNGPSSDAGAYEYVGPAPDADCALSPTSGVVYTRITVSCTDFKSGEIVSVRWDGVVFALFTAGSSGAGSVRITAPRSVTGRHLIKAVGDMGTSVPSRGFRIQPSISLSPTGGTVDQQINVVLRGFGAGEVIRLRFRTAPGSSRTVASGIVASSTGTASDTFKVPSGAVGKFSIEASGSVGGFASAPFTRIFGTAEEPTETPTPSPSATPALSPTATHTPEPTATATGSVPDPTATTVPTDVIETATASPTGPPPLASPTEPPTINPSTEVPTGGTPTASPVEHVAGMIARR